MTADLRCLTVRQPWAALIVAGVKGVENRSGGTSYRGRLGIHVAERLDMAAFDEPRHILPLASWFGCSPDEVIDRCFAQRRLVLGHVDLTGVHLAGAGGCCQPWGWSGPKVRHLVLAGARSIPDPVAARGQLGLWRPSAEVAAVLDRAAVP